MDLMNCKFANYRYKEAVSRLADIFAIERNSPLDNAAWLLEYVSKTKGAEHMKIASTGIVRI